MSTELVPTREDDVSNSLATFNDGLFRYLDEMGLPCENVLVGVDERRVVIRNLTDVVDRLSSEQKGDATYISKFIAAVGTGLFDAALNYLWDETVRNLRSKVVHFDLEYFYDTAITDPKFRSNFKSEDNLSDLPDWQLINGCQAIGLITELGFKHLDFIRDMRNFASAAHPNQNELTGLQLVQWMDTCIREVLGKAPSGPAIEARRLLRNLREQTLDASSAVPVKTALVALPSDQLVPILRTTFGMHTDPRLPAAARDNIRLVRKAIWGASPEDARYEIGLKFASFSAHGETDRAGFAREYLEAVGGLTYLPPDSLALEISTALDALLNTHNGWDNFYGEPSAAKAVHKLVPSSGSVPENVRTRYVKILTMCKLTNGHGVAQNAEPYYDRMIGTWQEKEILCFLLVCADFEVRIRLQKAKLCSMKFSQISRMLVDRTTNALALRGLNFIAQFKPDVAGGAISDSRFKKIVEEVKEVQ